MDTLLEEVESYMNSGEPTSMSAVYDYMMAKGTLLEKRIDAFIKERNAMWDGLQYKEGHNLTQFERIFETTAYASQLSAALEKKDLNDEVAQFIEQREFFIVAEPSPVGHIEEDGSSFILEELF